MIEQQQEQRQVEDEPLPEYGEVEGQKIKLAGLDYALLKQQTAKDRKSHLLKNIKNKLQDYTVKMPVEQAAPTHHRPTVQNDQLTKSIMMAGISKPLVSQNTSYLFPTDVEFSPLEPEVITRRFGKMHSLPLYIHHAPAEIEGFRYMLAEDEKLKASAEEQKRRVSEMLKEKNIESASDSDDIFGGGSSQNEEEEGKVEIKVGQKLNFGVKDDDIFGGASYKEKVQEAEQAPKIVDKYEFMRKRRKPNEQDYDGYGECYNDAGPSLDQMRELRKEGIELFQDAKEYTRKEKKVDLNKDYDKVKRIMEKNSKNGQ